MMSLMLLAGLADPAGLQAAGPHTVLGHLTEQAVPKCEGSEVQWVDPYFEVGFVPVRESAVDLRPWLGKPVWIRGLAVPGQRTFLREYPCVMAQWRSDWIPGPHGTRSLGHGETRPKGFDVQAAGPIELDAKRDGDGIQVTFKNPLPTPLDAVRISIQYEGCYGKPGADSRSNEPVTLAPDTTTRFHAPLLTERERVRGMGDRGQWHRADTVHVHGKADGVLVDLAVPLSTFGVTVECPKPGGQPGKLKAGGPG